MARDLAPEVGFFLLLFSHNFAMPHSYIPPSSGFGMRRLTFKHLNINFYNYTMKRLRLVRCERESMTLCNINAFLPFWCVANLRWAALINICFFLLFFNIFFLNLYWQHVPLIQTLPARDLTPETFYLINTLTKVHSRWTKSTPLYLLHNQCLPPDGDRSLSPICLVWRTACWDWEIVRGPRGGRYDAHNTF